MKKEEIIKFLIETMHIQMEEEFVTTDKKDYIAKCIEAKKWLLKQLHGSNDMIDIVDISNDIDNYLKGK